MKVASARESAAFYSKWLPGLVTGEGQKPGSFSEFGTLAPHLRFVERSSRKLARTTFMAMGRYQAGLEKKQAVLGRIVDIGAELFAIASAAVYANTIKLEVQIPTKYPIASVSTQPMPGWTVEVEKTMPLFGSVLAVLFLHEQFQFYHAGGIALIAAGIFLASFRLGRQPQAIPRPTTT